MPTIIGEEKKKEGTLKFGATDPITGRRFEEFTPNITSEMLIPAPSVPFVTPQDVPVFPVAGLDSTTLPLQPTAPETQAQDITKQLQELNQQLLGQSTLQAEQEKVQGIPELQKTQTDLTAQLKAIQNEALAIPLQLQKEATGRGITVGGLQPLQTARLRTNAIQALGVSSLLEASRGNLATAQTLADRAVAQKFDPIKEQIAVKTANLELIIKSPAYTLADKNRAQAQLDIQNKQKKAVEKQEADFAAILATANEASKNGADALTLDRISKAKTPIEALQSAQGFMDAEKDTQFTLSPGQVRFDAEGKVIARGSAEELSEIDRLNIEAKKLDIQQKIKDLQDIQGLDSKTVTQVDKISTSFDNSPIVKQFNEVQNKKLSVDKIIESGVGGPADLALVFEFMKALDPTSVVREAEYDKAAKAGNIFAGIFAKFNGYMKAEGGFLPEAVQKEFQKLIGSKFDVIQTQYSNLKSEKARLINQKTGNTDGDDYLIDYDFTASEPTPLPVLNQSYISLDALVKDKPEYIDLIEKIDAENPEYTDEDILQILQSGGFSQGGGGTPIAAGMRTDRHNNPTAFTTDIAKQAGLKEGRDYVVGDQFPDNPNQKTARLLGDPIDTTIKVIDKIGFFTASGKQRWTHTAISKSKWNSLTREQKKKVIKEMYQKEGGTQLLNAFA